MPSSEASCSVSSEMPHTPGEVPRKTRQDRPAGHLGEGPQRCKGDDGGLTCRTKGARRRCRDGGEDRQKGAQTNDSRPSQSAERLGLNLETLGDPIEAEQEMSKP